LGGIEFKIFQVFHREQQAFQALHGVTKMLYTPVFHKVTHNILNVNGINMVLTLDDKDDD
jgi:hypothetical protein